MTNTDFVRRYMGYASENSTATRYNTRWESTDNTTYGSGRGSGKSDIDNIYKLLLAYDRVCRDTASTGGGQSRSAKLPDSYPKGDINSLLGLEDG